MSQGLGPAQGDHADQRLLTTQSTEVTRTDGVTVGDLDEELDADELRLGEIETEAVGVAETDTAYDNVCETVTEALITAIEASEELQLSDEDTLAVGDALGATKSVSTILRDTLEEGDAVVDGEPDGDWDNDTGAGTHELSVHDWLEEGDVVVEGVPVIVLV